MTLLELLHQEYLKLKKIERQNNHLKKIYHRQYYLDKHQSGKINQLQNKKHTSVDISLEIAPPQQNNKKNTQNNIKKTIKTMENLVKKQAKL